MFPLTCDGLGDGLRERGGRNGDVRWAGMIDRDVRYRHLRFQMTNAW